MWPRIPSCAALKLNPRLTNLLESSGVASMISDSASLLSVSDIELPGRSFAVTLPPFGRVFYYAPP
jgi:hypothetical protein